MYLSVDSSNVHDKSLSLLMYSLMTEMMTSLKSRRSSCRRSCARRHIQVSYIFTINISFQPFASKRSNGCNIHINHVFSPDHCSTYSFFPASTVILSWFSRIKRCRPIQYSLHHHHHFRLLLSADKRNLIYTQTIYASMQRKIHNVECRRPVTPLDGCIH